MLSLSALDDQFSDLRICLQRIRLHFKLKHDVVANATTPTSDEIRDMIQSSVNASVTSAFTAMRITGRISSHGSFYFFTLMVH